MVICVGGNHRIMVCANRPKDDGGLHKRICRLSSAVCTARAAAVMRHLNNVALELVLIHRVADVECVSGRVTRDNGGRLLARCVGCDRTEDDGGGVEGVCNLGQIGFDGVKDLK